ncbi:metalloendopeptidase OMA1, mitochondrial-like [Acyrthosiphon pisum]|uniref:Metalloendopeptidase OMA1, mitochondrial n=1 Tax=Acyrthosiphon pisum TaxID=7029 RepID=A0A8R2JLE4_ACYPI|nr:metalloendopeptidase OMA1, mitochondrial-like [Acyrthosiphon pisum]
MTVTAGLCLIGTFLSSYIELDPWTDLWRLFMFSERTIEIRADKQVAIILAAMGKCCLLGIEHPTYKRVAGVTSQLLSANVNVDDIRKRQWSVVVVDSPMVNAFVMANGFIFVYSGLAAVANDDQLSIIIGHELAHCLLRHLNHLNSVNLAVHLMCMLPVAAVLSATLPFPYALFAVGMCQLVLYVCVELRTQRGHEVEADRVGLELAANACLDVTQGYRFWETMAMINGPSTRKWWLDTHPSDKSRARHLFSLIPATKELQKLAGC